MTRLATASLLDVAAWPTGTLHASPGGRLVGILLPKVTGHREVHQLYSPAQRKTHYPKADWAFLVHAAMNCAAAFETVHEHGHVIGDVNQSGLLVSDSGTIRLIDCDSFQVRGNGGLFHCVVGVPQYTPPELQGLSTFRSVERTRSHDGFGLALIVFHLLFMGRHPFVGRYGGTGEMPIERAISEGRFAYSRNASSVQMARPPHSLSLDACAAPVGRLVRGAFAKPNGSAQERPSAADWRLCWRRLKRHSFGVRPTQPTATLPTWPSARGAESRKRAGRPSSCRRRRSTASTTASTCWRHGGNPSGGPATGAGSPALPNAASADSRRRARGGSILAIRHDPVSSPSTSLRP